LSLSQEMWDTFRKLATLEARTEDVVRSLERIEGKIDGLIDRVSRVEVQYETLRESLRNEILADVKADIAVLKFAFGRPALDASPGAVKEIGPSDPSFRPGEILS
jgi:regulator of replication initiation timing